MHICKCSCLLERCGAVWWGDKGEMKHDRHAKVTFWAVSASLPAVARLGVLAHPLQLWASAALDWSQWTRGHSDPILTSVSSLWVWEWATVQICTCQQPVNYFAVPPLCRDQSLSLPIVYSTTHMKHLCYKTTSLQRPVPGHNSHLKQP